MGLGDIRLYECPASYFDGETLDVMGLVFTLERAGSGYLAGALADQPCWLVEAIEIYAAERLRLAGERNG